MSMLISEDRKELIVTCHCGCGNAFHIQLDKSLIDEDEPEDQKVYGYMSYMISYIWEVDCCSYLRSIRSS